MSLFLKFMVQIQEKSVSGLFIQSDAEDANYLNNLIDPYDNQGPRWTT